MGRSRISKGTAGLLAIDESLLLRDAKLLLLDVSSLLRSLASAKLVESRPLRGEAGRLVRDLLLPILLLKTKVVQLIQTLPGWSDLGCGIWSAR